MDDLHRQLTDFVQGKNQRIWGLAVWVPDIEDAPWDARVLTLPDPFGNHLRFNEPNDPSTHATLPDW